MTNQKLEQKALVELWSSPGIGPKTLAKIKQWCHEQSVSLSAFVAQPKAWTNTLSDLQRRSLADFLRCKDRFWQKIQANCWVVVTDEDPDYPQRLKQVDDHPLVLFSTHALPQTGWPIAVVGTRRITPYGKQVTTQLGQELTNAGAIIVSGGMYGVDITAHKTALDAAGQSIAVLGYGLGHKLPEWSERVIQSLRQQGLVCVTEYPPDTAPKAGHFPRRNRIIAGLSVGVVVTEAALESGSHITAKWALEYGRPVFAVPGPIFNPYSQGTKWLINEGAKLMTSVADIFEEIPDLESGQEPVRLIKKSLSQRSKSLSELTEGLQLSAEIITQALSLLEIQGRVVRQGSLWRWQS